MKLSLSDNLLNEVESIALAVKKNGGRALCVGGCVRDTLFNVEAKDVDLEIFGLEASVIEELLSDSYHVLKVGKAFGVFKLKGLPIDVSMPRRESKIGQGHKAFKIEGDPDLSFLQAAKRRDFTINALSWDPLNEELIDPLSGLSDINNRVLRHCSDQFAEDPLRVLRAMQFIARFDLEVSSDTLEICKTIQPEGLSNERIFDEWCKLLLKGSKISKGLSFLKDCGWIKYYPQLEALVDCEQAKQWHPEGDVWVHTLHCLDAFAQDRAGDEWEDLVVGFAVLCHDMGKPDTTVFEADGRISSKMHDVVGVPIAETFLKNMDAPNALVDQVLPLVEAHMRPIELFTNNAGDAAIRRLAQKVGRIDRLMRVFKADMKGRPPLPYHEFYDAEEYILKKAEELSLRDQQPQPLILGRHLIEEGLVPGVLFKSILNACFEAQLEGEFKDLESGRAYLKQYLLKVNKKG